MWWSGERSRDSRPLAFDHSRRGLPSWTPTSSSLATHPHPRPALCEPREVAALGPVHKAAMLPILLAAERGGSRDVETRLTLFPLRIHLFQLNANDGSTTAVHFT
jgi:hypothetical protein